MKLEDVALQVYCGLVARETPQSVPKSEAQKQEMARRAFTYATEFIAVCQEQTEGKR